MTPLNLSPLGHTWIFDLDGTLVRHNGYKMESGEVFLEGVEEFLKSIPDVDMIIFLTSRTDDQKELTEGFLRRHGVRYDHIIYNAPYGERIIVNDRKPSGLQTAVAINVERDRVCDLTIKVDETL